MKKQQIADLISSLRQHDPALAGLTQDELIRNVLELHLERLNHKQQLLNRINQIKETLNEMRTTITQLNKKTPFIL